MNLRAGLLSVVVVAASACAASSQPDASEADANASDASAADAASSDGSSPATACASRWNPGPRATIDGLPAYATIASANGATYLLTQSDGSGAGVTNAAIWSVQDWSAPSVSAASWVSNRGHYALFGLRDGSPGAFERAARTLKRLPDGGTIRSGIPESTAIDDVLFLRDETLVSRGAVVRRFAAVAEDSTAEGASRGSFSATDTVLGGRTLFAAPDQSRVYLIGPNGPDAEALVVDQAFTQVRAPQSLGGILGASALFGPTTAVATSDGLWVAHVSSSMQFVITLVRPDGTLENRFQEPAAAGFSVGSIDARATELAIATSAGVRIFDTVSNTMRQQIVDAPAAARTFAAYERDALVVVQAMSEARQTVFVRYLCN